MPSITSTASEEKSGEITREMNFLREVISNISDQVSALGNKLQPILPLAAVSSRERETTNTMNSKVDPPTEVMTTTSHGSEIRAIRNLARTASVDIRNILQVIEL